MTKRLHDKIALVTGGGGGIGAQIGRVFAAEGAHVYFTDIDIAAVEQQVAEVSSLGHRATAMALDVSKGQDVTAVFRAIAREQGRLDVIVNNAGLNVRGTSAT